MSARDCLHGEPASASVSYISSHAASIILDFSMRKLLVSKTVGTRVLSTNASSPWTEALTSESAILATKRGR